MSFKETSGEANVICPLKNESYPRKREPFIPCECFVFVFPQYDYSVDFSFFFSSRSV